MALVVLAHAVSGEEAAEVLSRTYVRRMGQEVAGGAHGGEDVEQDEWKGIWLVIISKNCAGNRSS